MRVNGTYMRTEVEVLTPLLETKRSALKKLARFEMVSRQRTRDVYLYDPLRDDLKPEPSSRIRRCFRVRTDGESGGTVTYKIDHFGADDEWRYSDGAGFQVSNSDAAVEIFHRLGFTTLCEIRSEKTSFSDGCYTLVLEDVADLGLFFEVKDKNAIDYGEEELDAAKKRVREYMTGSGLKLGLELNVGKPEMMLWSRFLQQRIGTKV